MPHSESSDVISTKRSATYSRKRPALVGVRLSPDELTTLRTVAAREGKTLPSALRDGFLRHAASSAD